MTDPQQGSAEGNPPAAWYGDDPTIKGIVETKGWAGPADVVQSYRHLEQMLGADKAGRAVIWPKDEADADGWKGIYSKLGRPDAPEGYKLPIPEGGNDEFAKKAAPVLHELGLSQKQAEKLAGFLNGYQQEQISGLDAKIAADLQADQTALKTEWGANHDSRQELAKRAALALGMTEDDIADVMSASGYAKTQKWLASIGEKLGEDKFVAGSGGKSVLTPESAKFQLEQLQRDKDWLNKWAAGDRDARALKDKLDAALLTPVG